MASTTCLPIMPPKEEKQKAVKYRLEVAENTSRHACNQKEVWKERHPQATNLEEGATTKDEMAGLEGIENTTRSSGLPHHVSETQPQMPNVDRAA